MCAHFEYASRGFIACVLVLAIAILRKPGTGFLFGLTQAIVVLVTGFFGSHGVASLITYTVPGIVGDLVTLLLPGRQTVFHHALICCLANVSGSLIVTVMIMRLPGLALSIALTAAAISGITGGILSWIIYRRLQITRVIACENSSSLS